MSTPGTDVAVIPAASRALSERDMKSIEFQSRALVLDPRIKAIEDPRERDEARLGLAISLYTYGLPISLVSARLIHLIPNQLPYESAQLLEGLLWREGHETRTIEESEDGVVLEGRRFGKGEPHRVTYSRAMARKSGALDTWVERWETSQGGKRYLAEKLVIERDGEPMNQPLPEWAAKAVKAGRAKSFDAWQKYDVDMMHNRAVRRLAKRMGGDVLMIVGGDGSDDEDYEPEPWPKAPPVDPATGKFLDPDDVPADGEIVDEPDAPASPAAFQGEGGPAAEDGAAQGSPPAASPDARDEPDDEEPFVTIDWVNRFVKACEPLVPTGVRPGELACALVGSVTAQRKHEPSTVRQGDEERRVKAKFVDLREKRLVAKKTAAGVVLDPVYAPNEEPW